MSIYLLRVITIIHKNGSAGDRDHALLSFFLKMLFSKNDRPATLKATTVLSSGYLLIPSQLLECARVAINAKKKKKKVSGSLILFNTCVAIA